MRDEENIFFLLTFPVSPSYAGQPEQNSIKVNPDQTLFENKQNIFSFPRIHGQKGSLGEREKLKESV